MRTSKLLAAIVGLAALAGGKKYDVYTSGRSGQVVVEGSVLNKNHVDAKSDFHTDPHFHWTKQAERNDVTFSSPFGKFTIDDKAFFNKYADGEKVSLVYDQTSIDTVTRLDGVVQDVETDKNPSRRLSMVGREKDVKNSQLSIRVSDYNEPIKVVYDFIPSGSIHVIK